MTSESGGSNDPGLVAYKMYGLFRRVFGVPGTRKEDENAQKLRQQDENCLPVWGHIQEFSLNKRTHGNQE